MPRATSRIWPCALAMCLGLLVAARPQALEQVGLHMPDASALGEALFYAVPGSTSLASFRDHADQVAIIAPQAFSLDSHGLLRSDLGTDLVEVAQQHQVGLMPLVINAEFSRWGAERLLRSAAARDRAVGELVQQAEQLNLLGWQLDFENLPSTQRAAYSRFVDEAAAALHRHGRLLSVAVAARTSDDPETNNFHDFSGVYDYTTLAGSADFLSVMAYPEGDGSHPGPLASVPWVEQVLQHVLDQVPPDKVSLGLPSYQTDWMERRYHRTVRERVAGQIKRVVQYFYRLIHHNGPVTLSGSDGLEWDPVLQSSYRVTGEGHARKVSWVEDERSFVAKLNLVAKYHLRGFSVWRIGLEDANIWSDLPNVTRADRASPSAAIPAAPALTLSPLIH